MSSTTMYRLSAISLLIGGGFAVIGAIVQSFLVEDYFSPLWIPVALLIFIGTLLIQIALPALYLRQMKQVGVLGLIGFVLLFFGFAMFGIGFRFFDIVILPWFGKNADINPPLNFIFYSLSGTFLLLVGALLFGIATIRAGVFPKLPIFLLFVGIVLNRIGGHVPHLQDIAGVLFYLSFAWFGYTLLSLLRQKVELQQSPVPTEAPIRA